MKYFPFAATLAVCGIFFFLATATSPPDDEFFLTEISADVSVADSNLLLTNTDTLDFIGATLVLAHETGDTLDGFPQRFFYRINNYNLAAGIADTIPLTAFVSFDSMVYPVDTFPQSFELDFFDPATGNNGQFFIEF